MGALHSVVSGLLAVTSRFNFLSPVPYNVIIALAVGEATKHYCLFGTRGGVGHACMIAQSSHDSLVANHIPAPYMQYIIAYVAGRYTRLHNRHSCTRFYSLLSYFLSRSP